MAFLTALGLSLFLTAVNVRYRDVPYAIPFVMQIWLFLSGVVYAINALPEKWQWLLALNPMTAVIAGFQWGVIGTGSPALGQDARQRCRDRRVRRVRALVLPALRAALRGHDMTASIATIDLSKSYRIGELQSAYGTLRDSLAAAARRAVHRSEAPTTRRSGRFATCRSRFPRARCSASSAGTAPGKSTLLKILTRITTPTSGRVELRGRVGSLLEVGTGFHPELTGRENVFLNGSVLGMKRQEIQKKFSEIVEFSGVEQFIDTPVKRYSSGMSVRLAFAVAAHLEPEILLIDEVLAVGDAEFQQRCLGRMEDMSNSGRTIVFVSHQMQAVAQLCDRAILLEKGGVVLDGPSGDVVAQYLQSVGGSSSTQFWPDLDSAPGDALVRLRSVRVVDSDGAVTDAVDVRDSVGIEIAFTVLRNGRAGDLPQDQAVRRPPQRDLQRARHERALARACAARRVRPPPRGSRAIS